MVFEVGIRECELGIAIWGLLLVLKYYSDRLLVCLPFKMSHYAAAFIIGDTK